MAKAANNNKSIVLEGVEVFYKENTDTLNIISTDPDLPKGHFFMQVKTGTPTDLALREVFAQKTGNQKPLGNPKTTFLPQETVTLTDMELKNHFERYTFPLGVSQNKEIVAWSFENDSNFPSNILVTGMPGCGKTIITEQIIRKAEIAKIPILKWSESLYSKDGLKKEQFKMELEKLFSEDKDKTVPTIVIIDGLAPYLTSSLNEFYSWDESLEDWDESFTQLLQMLALSRSMNVTFVLSNHRPDSKMQKKLAPYIGMNIVGTLETSTASVIALGNNDAQKLTTGYFIVKTGTETKGMKAYHPSMKSDWV